MVILFLRCRVLIFHCIFPLIARDIQTWQDFQSAWSTPGHVDDLMVKKITTLYIYDEEPRTNICQSNTVSLDNCWRVTGLTTRELLESLDIFTEQMSVLKSFLSTQYAFLSELNASRRGSNNQGDIFGYLLPFLLLKFAKSQSWVAYVKLLSPLRLAQLGTQKPRMERMQPLFPEFEGCTRWMLPGPAYSYIPRGQTFFRKVIEQAASTAATSQSRVSQGGRIIGAKGLLMYSRRPDVQ